MTDAAVAEIRDLITAQSEAAYQKTRADALASQLAQAEHDRDQARALTHKAEQDMARLSERSAELVEALRPFAREATNWLAADNPEGLMDIVKPYHCYGNEMTLGDFRRAARLAPPDSTPPTQRPDVSRNRGSVDTGGGDGL